MPLFPLPAGTERSWQLTIDGARRDGVSTLTLEDPRFGILTYGMSEMGYDTWSFHESGGGGVVSVPFVIARGDVLVGVVIQRRPNQGGDVPNVPRGFLDPNEDRAKAAARELAEETALAMDIVALEGEPANPNSAFFDTSRDGEGVRYFAAELRPEQLAVVDGQTVVAPMYLARTKDGEAARQLEAISRLVFLPWVDAARVADMFTVAGVSRLLAHLKARGRLPWSRAAEGP